MIYIGCSLFCGELFIIGELVAQKGEFIIVHVNFIEKKLIGKSLPIMGMLIPVVVLVGE